MPFIKSRNLRSILMISTVELEVYLIVKWKGKGKHCNKPEYGGKRILINKSN